MYGKFLPIPDAPNYEINENLVVRNKKTGEILKTQKRYRVYANGKEIRRTGENFYRQALTAFNDKLARRSRFIKIPSVNYLYEINQYGTLRNVKTKQVLKKQNNCIFRMMIDGKRVCRSVNSLLWEVHGMAYDLSRGVATKITAFKDGVCFNFDSLMAFARFLQPKINYSVKTIFTRLLDRPEEFYGYQVFYTPPTELFDVKVTVQKALRW